VITITCDNCDKPFEVDDDAQPGEKVSCPYCGDINRMPAPPAPSQAAGSSGAVAAVPKGKPLPAVPEGAMPHKRVSQPAQEDEEKEVMIVRQAMFRAHPFLYSLMILVILLGITWTIAALVQTQWARWHVWLGLIVALLGGVWWLIWWGAPHRWVKLIITNKRTIRQEGIVVRKTSEVLHSHIRNVKIEQSVLQRVLGVGSISIDTSGGTDHDNMIEIQMDNVAKPYDVKSVIDQYRGI
jgi:membrane protein YdbS with pleckstrin-like domain